MSKKNINDGIRVVMNQAMEEAKSYGDLFLLPEHLMIAIISNDNNNIALLKKMNLNLDTFYDKLSETLNSGIKPNLTNLKHKRIVPNESTKQILDNLETHAKMLSEDKIEVHHLVLSILDSESFVSTYLTSNNITYENYKEAYMESKHAPQNNTGDWEENGQEKEADKYSRTKKSKTPVLDFYCKDFSKISKEKLFDPVIGREVEIKRITQILMRRKKNNAIIIGEAGVGKTALVEGLSDLICSEACPKALENKRIFSLDLATVLSGTKYRGQFEERMKAIVDELGKNKDVILFIDEIHTIVGSGSSSGSMDAANLLKPALARNEMQIIGATTLNEYRESIEKDSALARRFQEVLVKEATVEETFVIIENVKSKYEEHHNIKFTPEAIKDAIMLSNVYITNRVLPDKVFDVLDEAGSITNLNISFPKEIVKLEEELETIKKQKKDMIVKQNYEEAAKIREKEKLIEFKLSKATANFNNKLSSAPKIIDSDLIREVISSICGVPISNINTGEKTKLTNIENVLSGTVIGQEDAIKKVSDVIRRSRVGLRKVNKPMASFIFLGPTGVGKTLLAKKIAENVFGNEDCLIRFDMSEFKEKFNISKLIGTPPGYVGYGEGGKLTEAVRRKPHSVVLFDEIEKADEEIFDILLQILDEGHITDGSGRKVNFKNTLVILTSNVGVGHRDQKKSVGFSTGNIDEIKKNEGYIRKALKEKFRPEFLNRIDDTIIFNSLSNEDIEVIVKHELKDVEARALEIGFKVKFTSKLISHIASEGYDKEYGARPVHRAIMNMVEIPLTDKILSLSEEDKPTLKVDFSTKENKVIITH